MKLDASVLRYLSKDDLRVLTAVELAMKNHEIAPVPLIESIAKLKRGGCYKCLTELLKHKLLHHDSQKYDGYRLTYAGYDILALRTLSARGVLVGLGNQVGVGKESDIYLAQTGEDEEPVIIKFQRLGRTSFRTIKRNRDYLRHRKNASWFYLSRLAALKEFAYLKVLKARGFPVPNPIDNSRHAIVMEKVNAYPMCQVRELANPDVVYRECMELILRFAEHGLIHGDFNEFNLMIDDSETLTVIDFPQMVSTTHENAEMYFDRDVQCIVTWFSKQYHYEDEWVPTFADVKQAEAGNELDIQVEASGFSKDMQRQLIKAAREAENEASDDDDEDEDEDEEEEEDGEEEEGEEGSNSDSEGYETDADESESTGEDKPPRGPKKKEKDSRHSRRQEARRRKGKGPVPTVQDRVKYQRSSQKKRQGHSRNATKSKNKGERYKLATDW